MEGCSSAGGVRKGAWTREEDVLLKQCIGKNGEGKWHLVPSRAGLNRCRKSCRLRWMNYLKPDIKRGEFSVDEVDLILRLHKLLGNRWSLIAGRIPGRTANDVKNYWNTHLRKKQLISKNDKIPTNPKNTEIVDAKSLDNQNILAKSKVIKPRPWTFRKQIVSPNPNTVEPPRTESPCWWESLLDDFASDDHVVDLLAEPAMDLSNSNKSNNLWDSVENGSEFWVENVLKNCWTDNFLADVSPWDVSAEDKDTVPLELN